MVYSKSTCSSNRRVARGFRRFPMLDDLMGFLEAGDPLIASMHSSRIPMVYSKSTCSSIRCVARGCRRFPICTSRKPPEVAAAAACMYRWGNRKRCIARGFRWFIQNRRVARLGVKARSARRRMFPFLVFMGSPFSQAPIASPMSSPHLSRRLQFPRPARGAGVLVHYG